MRRISIEAWLFLLVLAFNLYAAIAPANSLMMSWFSSDDAFYYFKTAQNIAEGRGITFDGIGRSSGFHPLWMLVCVPIFALARFDLILPLRLVVVVSGLLSAGTAVLLFRLARRALSREAAFLVGLFFAYSPFVHGRIVEMGLESGLSAFFLALLFERLAALTAGEDTSGGRVDARAYLNLGLVGLLTILARLDNVFFVLAAGAWLVVAGRGPAARGSELLRLRSTLALDVVLIIFGVLWSYFKRVGFGAQYAVLGQSAYWMAAAALVIRLALYYFAGAYARLEFSARGLLNFAARAVAASALASLLLGGLMLALQALKVFPGFPRMTVIYEAGFGLGALLSSRLLVGLLNAWLTRGSTPPAVQLAPLDLRSMLLRGACFALPIALGMIIYMGAHQAYFGTSSPVSGQIKRWWGTLPNPIYGKPARDLSALLGLTGKSRAWDMLNHLTRWPDFLPDGFRWILYAGLVGALLWLQRRHALDALARLPLLALFAGGFIHLISYTGTGYIHTRPWYWTGQMMLITLLFGVVIDAFLQTASGWLQAQAWWKVKLGALQGLSLAAGAWIVLAGALYLGGNLPLFIAPESQNDYLGGIKNLEGAVEPGSLVGSTGGGVIAYFAQNVTIVNMDGLMNSTEYFHMLQDGTARLYLDRIGLDYIYTGATVITDSDPYFQYKNNLLRIQEFPGISLFRWIPSEK